MDQELNPQEHQLWMSAIQILVHSEQPFVVFRIRMIQLKLEDNPFTHTFYLKMYRWKVLDISKKHL